MRRRLHVYAPMIAGLMVTFYASQLAAQVAEIPDWLAGKFTGTQTVTSRPTWAPAPIDINIAKSGGWKLNLGGAPGPASVEGTVTTVTDNTAVLSGKYTSGRNYGRPIVYKLALEADKTKGSVEADWITMPIAVELSR